MHREARGPMMTVAPARLISSSDSRRNLLMRKLLLVGMAFALSAAPMLTAAAKDKDNEKETDRLENAGTVM